MAKHDLLTLLPECFAIFCSIVLIWAGIGISLSYERQSNEHDALQDSINFANAFEDNAQRIVLGIDQTLLSIRTAYAADPEHFDIGAWQKQQSLPDRLRIQVGIISPAGIAIRSTTQSGAMAIDVSDREHFKAQLDPTHDDLFISKPVLGRGTGRQTVQFTRKLLRKDGSFGGVALVSLGCDELAQFYQTIAMGGSVLLVGLDGVVRARGPTIIDGIGIDLHKEPYFEKVASAGQGALKLGADSDPQIVGFRHLENYPLIVIVTFSQDYVYGAYYGRRDRWIVIGALMTMVAISLGGLWILQRRRFTVSKRALQVTLDSMNQGIVMVDARGHIPVMNRRAAELLEIPLSVRESRDASLTLHLYSMGAAGSAAGGMLHRGEKLIEVQNHVTPFGGSVLTYTDVTNRRRDENRIRHLAYHDGLTGLANRLLLSEKIGEAICNAANGSAFAIITLDLDRFKSINDGLGHDIGDLVLARVSERLLASVRAEDTVARVGGDEFTILVKDITQAEIAERIAQQLVAVLAEPMDIAGGICTIGASVGLAIFPDDATESGLLLKEADVALYAAKVGGRGRYRRFERGMNDAIEERRWLERELRQAMNDSKVGVYFQPQFETDTLAIVGFEALARWQHPDRGMISPDVFIPIAEECGLVIALGRDIFKQACTFAAAWHPKCRVAVNLSPMQFRDVDLLDLVADTLRRTGLQPHLLELEITEGVLVSDEAQALRTLCELQRMGVRIALDDFGIGYSSLSYLRRFPFDHVKIDKSFVQAQQTDSRARAILDAVIGMSHCLNLSVTAEGVETEEQLEALSSQGCSEVQGFLLGRPMTPAAVHDFLSEFGVTQEGTGLYVAASDGARRAVTIAARRPERLSCLLAAMRDEIGSAHTAYHRMPHL